MPMPHQTKYQWRPNDNGSLTNHRYDIEAEKWVSAIDKATFKARPTDWGADFKFIWAVISIPLLLFEFIFLIIILLIKEVVGYNIKLFPGDEPSGWVDKRTHMQKVHDSINELEEKYKDTGHPEISQDEILRMVAYSRSQTAKAKAKMTN